jgi:hypothetical protein
LEVLSTKEAIMKIRFVVFGFIYSLVLGIAFSLQAQELGPGFTKDRADRPNHTL